MNRIRDLALACFGAVTEIVPRLDTWLSYETPLSSPGVKRDARRMVTNAHSRRNVQLGVTYAF